MAVDLKNTLDSLGYDTSKGIDAVLPQALKDLETMSGLDGKEFDPATDGPAIVKAITEKAQGDAIPAMQAYANGQGFTGSFLGVSVTLNNQQLGKRIEGDLGGPRYMNNIPGVIGVMQDPQGLVDALDNHLQGKKLDLTATTAAVNTPAASGPASDGGIMDGLMHWIQDNANAGGFTGMMAQMAGQVMEFLGPLLKSLGIDLGAVFNQVAAPPQEPAPENELNQEAPESAPEPAPESAPVNEVASLEPEAEAEIDPNDHEVILDRIATLAEGMSDKMPLASADYLEKSQALLGEMGEAIDGGQALHAYQHDLLREAQKLGEVAGGDVGAEIKGLAGNLQEQWGVDLSETRPEPDAPKPPPKVEMTTAPVGGYGL